jgi:predicted phosphodiesterase
MNIARRDFLGGGAVLLGAGALAPSAGASGAKRKDAPRVSFGVVTDAHIGTEWMKGINNAAVKKALEFFKARGVDAVAATGDMANNGYIWQLEEFAGIWNEVFPGGRGIGGKKVEKLFIAGNHELSTWLAREKQSPEKHIAPNVEKVWQRCFGEEYSPVWHKEINGIQFVGANWTVAPGGPYRKEDIEGALAEAGRRARKGDPVFHLRHAPPARTCWGSREGAYGTAESVYGNDERLFVISGHLHTPLAHPESIWQGSYTVLNAGAVTWSCFPGSGYPKTLLEGAVYSKDMSIVSVYDDEITVERFNICTEEQFGETWHIPLPLEKANFRYTAEKIRSRAVAPVFPAGARVSANLGMGEHTLLKMPLSMDAGRGEGGVLLSFPAAGMPTAGDDMVMYYEVTAVGADDGKEAAKRNFYTQFYRGASYTAGMMDFLFGEKDLTDGGAYRFQVRAVDFFGKKSSPLISDKVTFKRFNRS